MAASSGPNGRNPPAGTNIHEIAKVRTRKAASGWRLNRPLTPLSPAGGAGPGLFAGAVVGSTGSCWITEVFIGAASRRSGDSGRRETTRSRGRVSGRFLRVGRLVGVLNDASPRVSSSRWTGLARPPSRWRARGGGEVVSRGPISGGANCGTLRSASDSKVREEGPTDSPRPKLGVLWALALAGCAGAAVAVALAFASDHVAQPGLRAALLDWISVPYILAGLVAWARRPESRLGPLMVAAGSPCCSGTCSSNAAAPAPSACCSTSCRRPSSCTCTSRSRAGACARRSSARSWGRAYVGRRSPCRCSRCARRVRPRQPAGDLTACRAAHTVEQVQLLSIGAMCLVAIGLLTNRRRHAGRPLRRPLALVVDSFAGSGDARGAVRSARLVVVSSRDPALTS